MRDCRDIVCETSIRAEARSFNRRRQADGRRFLSSQRVERRNDSFWHWRPRLGVTFAGRIGRKGLGVHGLVGEGARGRLSRSVDRAAGGFRASEVIGGGPRIDPKVSARRWFETDLSLRAGLPQQVRAQSESPGERRR
jgi:hypothetical protein